MIIMTKVKDKLPEIVTDDRWSNPLLLYYQYTVNNKRYFGYAIGYFIENHDGDSDEPYSWWIRFKDGKDQKVLAWCELPDKLYEETKEE